MATMGASTTRSVRAGARVGRGRATATRMTATRRTIDGDAEAGDGTSRRRAVATLMTLATGAIAVGRAEAETPPEFVDETREIIDMTRQILTGAKSDDAYLDNFQDKRRAWFAKYQYHHGKSFYGYANTWNAQAKVGVQIAVNRENGVPYDYAHTVYNKDYLLKILEKGEAELLDMQSRNAL